MHRLGYPISTARPCGKTAGRLAAVLTAVALAATGTQAPAHAATAHAGAVEGADSKKAVAAPLCAATKKGQFRCLALKRTDVAGGKGLRPLAAVAGYGPADLASAYRLPAGGGAGTTIAIVDANDDPNAEADLAVYRAQFGLPACRAASGCFTKVDQTGGAKYPAPDSGWAGEISIDLDMVSAVAPAAHILLVEANSADWDNMGAAVDEAVALGAGFVSNSYGSSYNANAGSGEDPAETTTLDAHYNHPGVAVVASSGDSSYGVGYPAASPYVTSVGGTSLKRDDSSTRGWGESVWSGIEGGPGSGCSVYEPKPAFQKDTGCAMRTVADVSAVADPQTGVATYDSYQESGWVEFGGTSVSAPIIAGVYADAGNPARGSYPNSYPYAKPDALNDVTTGYNGTCDPTYLCQAGPGYDGPTGLGTPNGVDAFASGPQGLVTGTVTDSGGAPVSGAKVTVGSASAVTDANGGYRLSVSAGSYTISVSDFGYVTQTVKGEVADKATVTQNFTLASVPRVAVTGAVTDGSGQGWPIYAAISVEGVPGGPVYTDPKTGAYTLRLPVNASYTLDVSSVYTGYQMVKRPLTVGSTTVTKDVAVPVDALACDAHGYTLHQQGNSETFDATSTPENWTIADAGAPGWEFYDPDHRGNLTGGVGGFAIVDSYHAGHQVDSILTGPVTDLSAISDPSLSFDTYYREHDASVADVDVSTDGGATWESVWQYSTTGVRGGHVSIPLPQAKGKTAVQARFHYTGLASYFWEVDDVVLGRSACDPVPGGLVIGQVTDANTGGAVAGATVTEVGTPPVATTSAALADPARKGAFYWMFSPRIGAQSVTVDKGGYASARASTTVVASGVAERDFALKAGRFAVTPSSISKTLAWGGAGAATVAVKNIGSAPATLSLDSLNGQFTMQGVKPSAAPVQRVTGTFPKTDMAVANRALRKNANAAQPAAAAPTAGTAWQSIANYPTPIQDNIAEYHNGKLYSGFGYTGIEGGDTSALYSYDPTAAVWTALAGASDMRESPAHGFIGGRLYVTGGWSSSGHPDSQTEIYNPQNNTWTKGPDWSGALAGSGSAVLGSKLYVIGGCSASGCGTTSVSVLDALTGKWSTASPYPEPTSWLGCGAIAGKIYCAGGDSEDYGASQHTYVYNPTSNFWTRLADMPFAVWGSAYTAANGLLLLQRGVAGGAMTNQGSAYDPTSDTWTALPNANEASYRVAGALGFYTIGGGIASSNSGIPPLNTAAVLSGYGQADNSAAPWLSLSATSVTLAPGKSATVTVTLHAADPSIVQPGAYTAALLFLSDTPYQGRTVPVTMTVKPPSTWGKITGAVQHTDKSGKLVPISGVTVQIDSWTAHYTLHTDADGNYALWLDYRNNPLTVIAAKDGYQPKVATAKITKGATVTLPFTLLKD